MLLFKLQHIVVRIPLIENLLYIYKNKCFKKATKVFKIYIFKLKKQLNKKLKQVVQNNKILHLST